MTETRIEQEHPDKWEYYLTVGELRKKLEGLPDDMPVYYQRIEDVFFKKHGWKPVEMMDQYHRQIPDEFVRAFDAWSQEGRFVLSAHY